MDNEAPRFNQRVVPDPEIAAHMGGLSIDHFEFPDEEPAAEPAPAYEPPVDETAPPLDTDPESLPSQWTPAERSAHLAGNPGMKQRSLEEHMARIEQEAERAELEGDEHVFKPKTS